MNIFEKIFKKKSKKKDAPEEKQECWYNNAHESAESTLGEPLEGAALAGPNQFEISVTKSNAMK